jgi:integrase
VPAKGDGITKRKDGLYMARYTIQTPDGPKRKAIYGRKYNEVKRKRELAVGDAAKGIIYDGENLTVGEYMTQWLEDSAKGHLAPASYRNYELQIRRHISPALGSLKLSQLTPAHVQPLYASKLQAGMKPASVRYIHAVLHRALEQVFRFNLILLNAAAKVDPPKVRQEEITPLDAERATRLLDMAHGEVDRFEALYVGALTTGLRIGELPGLKWSDIDLENRTLRVSRQLQRGEIEGRAKRTLVFTEPKNASGRTVDLPRRTVEALKNHRKRQLEDQLRAGVQWADYGLVFATRTGTPYDYQTVTSRHLKPLLKRAALPDIRFHDLRHTYVTLLLARGTHPTYVQKPLGHANMAM